MGRLFQRAGTATWAGKLDGGDTIPDCGRSDFDDDGGTTAQRVRRRWPQGSGEIVVRPPTESTVPPYLGPYRLLGVLGEGGAARVYLAEHTIIGKRVAIKTLLPHLARCQAAHTVFVREARIAGSIRHPNLVDVYDFGFSEGQPYYVMELAPGETLARRIERAPLLLAQALDIAIKVCEAVAAIHHAGYLHRDIKSENVLLVPDGRRLVPKLIDFGIARSIVCNPDDVDGEGMVGTPRTMAPEQISQDAVDERTDLWAVGVLLYEAMTGHLPFPTGASIRDDLVAIVTEPPMPLGLGFPEDVRRAIMSCLSKEPEARPVSANALARSLLRARTCYLERHELVERAIDHPDDDIISSTGPAAHRVAAAGAR